LIWVCRSDALVVGSDLVFDSRGRHELKGVPGEWEVYAVSESG
jgi:hypothetical protein